MKGLPTPVFDYEPGGAFDLLESGIEEDGTRVHALVQAQGERAGYSTQGRQRIAQGEIHTPFTLHNLPCAGADEREVFLHSGNRRRRGGQSFQRLDLQLDKVFPRFGHAFRRKLCIFRNPEMPVEPCPYFRPRLALNGRRIGGELRVHDAFQFGAVISLLPELRKK